MITLRQIAAKIHRVLNGGQANTDSEYDDRYTISLVRPAMNEVLAIQWVNRRSSDDDRTLEKMNIATYHSIIVKNDDATGRSYADLPDFYASLPYNRGVHQVSAMDKPLEPMIQRLNPSVTRTLPCGRLQGRKGYYVEGLRIYFDKLINKKAVVKVLIKLIVAAPNSLGIDDPLPIIPEQERRIRLMVIEEYRIEGIQDKVVDSNKDIGVKTGGGQ